MEPRRPIDDPHLSSRAVTEQLAQYPLLKALIERRTPARSLDVPGLRRL